MNNTPEKSSEEKVKDIMYGDDLDFVLSLQDGGISYPKPYQLRLKIEDAISQTKADTIQEVREEYKKALHRCYNKLDSTILRTHDL